MRETLFFWLLSSGVALFFVGLTLALVNHDPAIANYSNASWLIGVGMAVLAAVVIREKRS